MDLINRAVRVVCEYGKAMEINVKSKNCRSSSTRWTAPPVGIYKLNSDAAILEKSIGLGAIMRDNIGDVMVATCDFEEGCFEVDIAEAMATRHGLRIALEAGLSKIILETDCMKLFYALQKGKGDNSMFGCVVKDILTLASLCTSISYSHAKRNGNLAAHKLDKLRISTK